MENIKEMIMGVALLLFVILIHLAVTNLLLTDFLAILGIIMVCGAYFKKNTK